LVKLEQAEIEHLKKIEFLGERYKNK